MTDYVVGVDIGTSSTKALAIDSSGKVISTIQIHYSAKTPIPGRSEQDPEIVLNAFVECVQKLVLGRQYSPKAIILSSAMHSVIPVNQNAESLHPMIVWSDNRSAKIAERIKHSAMGEVLYEQTGTPIHAMSPLSKIIWLKENDPGLFSRTNKFISIKEFIWYRLFREFEVDHSIASATGLMDIENLQWNSNALDTAGINTNQLSQLVATSFQRSHPDSELASTLCIDPTTAFIIGASDGCLANLGSSAYSQGVASLTIGTSGAIRVAGKQPIFNYKAMVFNYRLDEETYISGGPTNNGGIVLKWYAENFLKKQLTTADDYSSLLQSLKNTEASDGLIFLPYLFGERAPIWNSEASGVFFGIKNYHTQDHFTRAVIEGISFALADIAENLDAADLPISIIHVSGGFVRSKAWLQILSDILQRRIALLHTEDASALGAGYLGLKTLGWVDGYHAFRSEPVDEIFPDPAKATYYKNQLIRYRKVYHQLEPLMQNEID
jgi:gluconokinase